MYPFLFQKTVSINFFTDSHVWNFFFTEESVCFHAIDCLSGKPMISLKISLETSVEA